MVHKPGKGRKNYSYIFYYICAKQQMQGRATCGHSNRVLAKISEAWIVEQVQNLVSSESVVEAAFAMARDKVGRDLQPQQEALHSVKVALQENQSKIDRLVETISSGNATDDLLGMLNDKATEFKRERESLYAEQRQLNASLTPLADYADALPLREALSDFAELAKEAEPLEMRRLMRTLLRRVEWMPDGTHAAEFYSLPVRKSFVQNTFVPNTLAYSEELYGQNQKSEHGEKPHSDDWLERNMRFSSPQCRNVEPVWIELIYLNSDLQSAGTTLGCG